MNESDLKVATAHGRLDKAALLDAQNSYDTQRLLRAVDELDKLIAGIADQGGLRETLLRLHGMAHAVINDAGLTVATDRESLPELAAEGVAELQETISMLQGWVRAIEALGKAADSGLSRRADSATCHFWPYPG